jgi:hypothetical protein
VGDSIGIIDGGEVFTIDKEKINNYNFGRFEFKILTDMNSNPSSKEFVVQDEEEFTNIRKKNV